MKKVMLVCCAAIVSSLLISCSSKESVYSSPETISTTSSSMEVSSAIETESSKYLKLDTSKLENFELSPLVKEVVGTYSLTIDSDVIALNYDIKINEDGTYEILSYAPEILRESARRVHYLDKSGAHVTTTLTREESGKTVDYGRLTRRFDLVRGVLVEKYGQLYFKNLSSVSPNLYLDIDGNIDIVKGIAQKTTLSKLPETEEIYEDLMENFRYNETADVEELPELSIYIEDGKFYYKEEELITSTPFPYSPDFISKDLTDLFSRENMSNIIQSPNDLLQYAATLREDATVSLFTDFDNLYTEEGEKIEADYAILVYDYGETVYVEHDGKVRYASKVNGKFIIGN